jgi:hypothetical protein
MPSSLIYPENRKKSITAYLIVFSQKTIGTKSRIALQRQQARLG